MNSLKLFYSPYLYLLSALFALVACSSEQHSIQVNPLFSDHMVLQQEEEITIWGTASPNISISLSANWTEKLETNTDAEGTWSIKFQTPEAGGPYSLTIATDKEEISLKDILIGEVWLASGQSNMEMPLNGWPPRDTLLNSKNEIASAGNNMIRMFTVERNLSLERTNDFRGEWFVSSPETAGDFSATAYFFAKRLQKELNIPIGIIHSSWGGTPVEAWISKTSLKELGDYDEALLSLEDPNMVELKNEWYSRWRTVEIPSKNNDWLELNLGDLGLSDPNYDASSWEKIDLPGPIDQRENWQMDGVIWLRKSFLLKEEPIEDYTLSLGAVDDMDYTYVNGQQVGLTVGKGKHTFKRTYSIPKSLLKKGENLLAIRVIDTGGGGGLNDSITLSGNDESIDLSGTWELLPAAEIYEGQFYVYDLKESLSLDRPNIVEINSHSPTVLFNAMIAPLVPYSIKGAIWYQGESNVGRASQYERLFPKMIEDWRSQWQINFPFYFVQIAPFNYGNNLSPALRDAQRKTLELKNTGMVVTLDIGDPVNIHPANKKDVGERLAGLALKNEHTKELIASGPLYKNHLIEGNKIIVSFSHLGSGLMASELPLQGFEIAGEDRIFKDAKAVIANDKIELTAAGIAVPKFVRYAWKDTSEATLFNNEGLPASSFSSETN